MPQASPVKTWETSDSLFNRLMNQTLKGKVKDPSQEFVEFLNELDELNRDLKKLSEAEDHARDFNELLAKYPKTRNRTVKIQRGADWIAQRTAAAAQKIEVVELSKATQNAVQLHAPAGGGGIPPGGTEAASQIERAHAKSAILQRLKALGGAWKSFVRASAVSWAIDRLLIEVVYESQRVWRFYYDQVPLDPEKYSRHSCHGNATQAKGGIWREDDVEELIRRCDSYNVRVSQIWDEIAGGFSVSVVRFFLRDLRPDYIESASRLTREILSGIQPSRFGEQHPKKTRDGVRPRRSGFP